MPKKVSIKLTGTLALVSLGLFTLSGCSTIADGVNSAGKGMVTVGEGFEKLTSDVSVEKLSEDRYRLSETFNEPVTSLDSWAMRIEAREVCTEGYVYLSRNARKTGGFAYSDLQCTGGMSCSYDLEWRIKCQDVPKEPLSLFGKT